VKTGLRQACSGGVQPRALMVRPGSILAYPLVIDGDSAQTVKKWVRGARWRVEEPELGSGGRLRATQAQREAMWRKWAPRQPMISRSKPK